jgi:hypothetical protein
MVPSALVTFIAILEMEREGVLITDMALPRDVVITQKGRDVEARAVLQPLARINPAIVVGIRGVIPMPFELLVAVRSSQDPAESRQGLKLSVSEDVSRLIAMGKQVLTGPSVWA